MGRGVTGRYTVCDGRVIKVSDEVPSLERPVYFKRDVPYFDRTARRTFASRQEKRRWLKQHGLREGGIINPDHPPA